MNQRRARLLGRLEHTSTPMTGSELSKFLGVSRQVVVSDVAILRAAGHDIVATPRGYRLSRATSDDPLSAQIAVCHRPEDTETELMTMVEAKVRVIDVTVEHPVYGDLCGNLLMETPSDVRRFLRRLEEARAPLLSDLTGGVHLHRVEFDKIADFRRAEEALRDLGFLAEG